MSTIDRVIAPLALLLAGACASVPAARSTAEGIPVPGTPEARRTPELPAIPPVDGPLQLDVGYPPEDATIAVRDSNFIFGSTGSGRAQLTINGHAVDVAPNGGFLGFIPVPLDGVYRLNAAKNGETATLERRVSVPAPAGPSGVAITSVFPRGAIAVQTGETIEIGFRAPPGVRATVLLPDGRRVQLVEQGGALEALPGDEFRADLTTAQRQAASVRYSSLIRIDAPIVTPDTSVARPRIGALDTVRSGVPVDEPVVDVPLGVPAPNGRPLVAPAGTSAILEIIAGADTVREPLPLNV
ncbi:MAG: hypothetical protein ACREK1_07855, partial [Longimicrobiales bacterium]